MSTLRRYPASLVVAHGILGFFSLLALAPIALIVMNAFKSRSAIFSSPLAWPTAETVDLIGFSTVLGGSNFMGYFANSLIVTLASLAGILLFGAMAAFALLSFAAVPFGRWLDRSRTVVVDER